MNYLNDQDPNSPYTPKIKSRGEPERTRPPSSPKPIIITPITVPTPKPLPATTPLPPKKPSNGVI
jgi:hypothetical protein